MATRFLRRFIAKPEESGRLDDAEREAERLKASGNDLFIRQRLEEALACYRQALAVKPDYGDAQWNVAMAALFLGDYATGFEYFEKRFLAGDKAHQAHLQGVMAMMAGKHLWGGERLQGERLLVWTEQGFGDSLLFLRYLPMIASMGRCCLLVACEPELVRIMRGVPGVDNVLSKDDALAADQFDVHCSLLSLPHRFGTTMETLPNAVPYLSAPAAIGLRWRGKLDKLAGKKVGLVWAGGRQLAQDSLRSFALKEFAPLMDVPGVSFISLQKGEPGRELDALGWPVADWMAECSDFLDTAGLVDELDLVVSADTAVAHLAGALGKPVWLLNRFESEWRWMLEREDSPWYPTMRIFRQPAPHDWPGVMRAVEAQLIGFARGL